MLLSAALVPPPDVLERVCGVVTDALPPPAPAAPARSRRWFRRRSAAPPAPAGSPGSPRAAVDLLPVRAMHLPITKFGNLSLADAGRLADALDEAARTWETPRLRLSGGVALEPHGDDAVRVALAGDLEALNTLTHGVAKVAQRLHLFVDRRGFRPHLRLATIDRRAVEDAHLRDVVAALDGFESDAWWMTTISLVMPVDHGQDKEVLRTYRDIPLGPAVSH